MVGALLPALLLGFLAQEGGAPNTVVASGAAVKTLVGDQATLGVWIEVKKPDSAAARAAAESLRARVVQAARNTLPSPRAYKPLDIDVYSEGETFADARGGAAKPGAYRARAGLEIVGVDLARVDAVAKAVGTVEGANAVPVRYGFKDEAAVRRTILKDAFNEARRKAQETAEAAGLRLGEVYLLDAGAGPTFQQLFEGTSQNGMLLQSAPMKSIRVAASVTVRFRLVK